MSNGVEQQVGPASLADLIPVAAGVALFAWWLLNTSLGRTSLVQSRPRRNSMGLLLPFAVFFVWVLTQEMLRMIVVPLARRLPDSGASILLGAAGAVGSLMLVALVLIVARMAFARGLKGLGLRLRTIPQDLAHAFLTLLGVWPLVAAAMSLTILVMKALDESFEVPQHEALQVITQSNSAPLQTLMVVLAVAVAPLVEELLFRGLFQTMIRSYVGRPWPAIVIASILFAVIHQDAEHWPALFVLALGLGYSYEKSGSLLRAIFMHAMFNGISIVSVLAESPPT
ncbi:MAG TPA: type II CAAX endopeptidase family protein [Sedimentisphaerales bacterium]|nr:type II CAAX endopeptidase family protein [Sedimentisphaerales bacterium]